jgi:type IV pilus assembly protein PilA
MLHKLRERAQDEKGFTLIELLVVILIIGILAAIAIPAFLGQRARAQDTAAKSMVRQAQTAMETYYTDNQSYTGASLATLQAIDGALTTDLTAVSPTANGNGYTLTARSRTANTFSITKSDTTGAITRSCTNTGAANGGCPTNNGSW